jgi:hypothetical protein
VLPNVSMVRSVLGSLQQRTMSQVASIMAE